MSTTPAAPDAAGAHPAGPFQTRAGAYALIVDGGRVLLSSWQGPEFLQWTLPGGGIELGESPEEACLREVWEETGIVGEAFDTLGTIDYWFVSDGVRIHKTVHHNLLRYVDGILNDEDPEVTEVAWVPLGELESRLAYADERRLVRRATELLADSA